MATPYTYILLGILVGFCCGFVITAQIDKSALPIACSKYAVEKAKTGIHLLKELKQ